MGPEAGRTRWRKGTPLLWAGSMLLALGFGARVYHYAGVADVEQKVVKTRPSRFRVEGVRLVKTVANGELELRADVAQPGQELSLSFTGGNPGVFISLVNAQATLRRQGMELWTATGVVARLSKESVEFPKSAVMRTERGETRNYRRLRINLDTGWPSGEKE
jgi:hypothetical protein